jgi:hypothetical protein
MAKHESRISENAREYEGEAQAAPLINWLNSTKDGDDAKTRILDIAYSFLKLNVEGAEIFGNREAYDKKQSKTVTFERADWLEAQLRGTLDYYTVVPHVVFAPQGFAIGWKVAPDSEFERDQKRLQRRPRRPKDPLSPSAEKLEEVDALTTMLELFKNGLILKIRRCTCNKFYFAKFRHQQSCSEKCRIAKFKTSDQARRKRNEYARKLYRLHKSGKVK